MKFTLNFKYIFRIYGYIILLIGLAMLPAFITSWAYNEPDISIGFLTSGLVATTIGALLIIVSQPQHHNLKARDVYMIVGLAWPIMAFFGALPYIVSGYTESFASALFESTAGFTTTTATAFIVEVTPKGLLMWKAICHWLGGLAILVFLVGFLSALGSGGNKIFSDEFPVLTSDKPISKFADSKRMFYVYLFFTVTEFIFLSFSEMNLFDNLVTTMGCVSTSGLFAHSSGIAYFDSIYIEAVIIVYTILSAISYTLYPMIARGRFREVLRNSEVKTYLTILLVAIIIVAFNLFTTGTCETIGDSLRYAAFYSASFATTSGYNVVDYGSWPTMCLVTFVILMLIGGCTASTSGSIKVARIMVMVKLMTQTFYKRIHPHAVMDVQIGDTHVSSQVVACVTSFILSFFAIILGSSVVVSLQGFDLSTNLSVVIAMMTNTGIYLGDFGALGYFGIFSDGLQIFLAFLMIIGRLEIFSVLILFSPSFWHPSRTID